MRLQFTNKIKLRILTFSGIQETSHVSHSNPTGMHQPIPVGNQESLWQALRFSWERKLRLGEYQTENVLICLLWTATLIELCKSWCFWWTSVPLQYHWTSGYPLRLQFPLQIPATRQSFFSRQSNVVSTTWVKSKCWPFDSTYTIVDKLHFWRIWNKPNLKRFSWEVPRCVFDGTPSGTFHFVFEMLFRKNRLLTHLISDSLEHLQLVIQNCERLVRLGFTIEYKADVPSLPLHVVEIYQRRVHTAANKEARFYNIVHHFEGKKKYSFRSENIFFVVPSTRNTQTDFLFSPNTGPFLVDFTDVGG